MSIKSKLILRLLKQKAIDTFEIENMADCNKSNCQTVGKFLRQ